MKDKWGNNYIQGWTRIEENWLDAIMQMGARADHIQELSELTGRTVCAIERRIQRRLDASRLRRSQISDYVLAVASALGQMAEEFAEAVNQPLSVILDRAERVGISLKRARYDRIAQNIQMSRDPVPVVVIEHRGRIT